MKRSLNTSYRLVWNKTLGIFIAVSELTRSHRKKSGVALSLGVAALTLGATAQAASTEIPVGETVNGTVLDNGDYQSVYGQANNTTIKDGGRQVIWSGGVADNTTITAGNTGGNTSSQDINEGGKAVNTTVTGIADSSGECMFKSSCADKDKFIVASQELNGFSEYGKPVEKGATAIGTVLNAGGVQYIEETATAVDTIINANGHQQVFGGVDEDGIYYAAGLATGSVINAGGAQSLVNGGHAINTTVSTDTSGNTPKGTAYQIVLGADSLAENTTINNGGLQFVSDGGSAINSVVNNGGTLVLQARNSDFINSEGEADNEDNRPASANGVTVNQGGKISIGEGTFATDVTMNDGGALVASTASTVTGTNSKGEFSINAETGEANNVLLENGGRLDVLVDGFATNTTVNQGGTLAVASGGVADGVLMNSGGVLAAEDGSTVNNITTGAGSTVSVGSDSELNVTGNAALAGDIVNDGLLRVSTDQNTTSVLSGGISGDGQLRKKGDGTLTLNGGNLTQSEIALEQGTLALNNATVNTDIIAQSGTRVVMSGNTVMNGAIDPTDVTLESGASWNIARGASVKSVLDNLDNAGTISFTPPQNSFAPETLTVKNLTGRNGTINMSIRLDDPTFPTDMLVIDGGKATGKTWLNFTSAGGAGLGLATTGDGIKVVDAINGATTEAEAFALKNRLQAGAYNYTLSHGTTDENWYLTSEEGYRAETALYASLFAQTMDYDRALAGSYSQRSNAVTDQGFWGRIQGGHIGHSDSGSLAKGDTPESSGSYGFVQLGADLLRTDAGPLSLTSGLYAAAGRSSVDVKNDDRSRAGSVHDDVYSAGAYLTAIHPVTGLWADVVAQGSRHNLKASSDMNNFDTHGWGWLGSVETGLPLHVTDSLVLEPQLQYIWQGIALNNGHDNGGYVKFDDGSAQHIRAGIRFGSQSEMAFGQGTSTRDGFGDSAKHQATELPVNWWVRPSVIRTFSSDGDLNMGTATAGSNVTFTPSQDGTSLDLQAGVEALVRQNVSLGVQAGYTHSVSGNSTEGYNGQATLKVTF